MFALSGCELTRHYETHDPSLDYKENVYEDRLTQKPKVKNPRKYRRKVTPKPIIPAKMKRKVTVELSESVPVKDLLLRLASQQNISIAIRPDVSGHVNFAVHDEPFIQVVSQICDLTGLRYQIRGGMIVIENDTPYHKTYNLSYLSMVRENSSRVSIATDVFATMDYGGGNREEIDNGSNTVLKASNKSDFWSDLERNLNMILASGDKGDSQIQYTVNQQAGLVSVRATQHQHNRLENFLKHLKNSVAQQVLIEAKIVEINLNKSFQSGINWSAVHKDFVMNAPLGRVALQGQFNPTAVPQRDVFSIGAAGRSLTSIASFLNQFGTVRTLSNPRMTVTNNQNAIIKVATNRVFFRVRYNREIQANNLPNIERAYSDIHTVPIGLVMTVQPSVNPETGEVTLTMRPTVSRVIRELEDPAVGILTSANPRASLVPEVQVRELDSVIKVGSGDVIIMGGLMEERSDNEMSGLPGTKNVPLLNMAANGKSDDRQVSELVVMLRVTVLDESGESIDPADERLYKSFTKDPRAFEFEGSNLHEDELKIVSSEKAELK